MLKNFRTFPLAVTFYHQVAYLRLPSHLRDQLLRAASSVCLNLSEGAAKSSPRDQKRFFEISFGSLRESQAISLLSVESSHETVKTADHLAASLDRLLHYRPSR